MPVTVSPLSKKLVDLGACKEGRDWIDAGRYVEYRATWRACPAPEFLCWLATRTMGLEGVRGAVACTKAAAQVHDVPLLKQTVQLCEQVLDRKSTDTKKLQVLAFDATESALANKKPSGPALLSAAYAAYAVHFAVLSQQDTDVEAKKKHILKAAQHSSDAASHAQKAVPPRSGLANLVRSTINEEAAYRAWQSLTGAVTSAG